MSRSGTDESLTRLTADLARSLRDLQRELEPRPPGPRPPTPRELLRFTDEVAIPAIILVLETNVRALRLLQRAVRLADGGGDSTTTDRETPVRDRAIDVSRTTLTRLDDALAELQSAIEGRPEDDDARELLSEARTLRDEIDERLADESPTTATTTAGDPERTEVPVDVDAELQSIKDDLDQRDTGGDDDGTDH